MKTAVEWLMEELPKNGSGAVRTFGDLFEQAKEMHKVQIMNAFHEGCFDQNAWRNEEYYNETFKQQETETYPCPQCQGGGCPYCCGYGTIPK